MFKKKISVKKAVSFPSDVLRCGLPRGLRPERAQPLLRLKLFEEDAEVSDGADFLDLVVFAERDAEFALESDDEVDHVDAVQPEVVKERFFGGELGGVELEFVDECVVDSFDDLIACQVHI